MISALDAARYIIHVATPRDDEGSDFLCHMRLQKLLYYTQAWHLASAGVPLFAERIEARQYGPVVPAVYAVFKSFRLAIPAAEGRVPESLAEGNKIFIRSVRERYKRFSATALSSATHADAPWVSARGGLPPDARGSGEITTSSLRSYFLPKLVESLKWKDSRIDPGMWQASADAVAAGRVQTPRDIRRELHRRRAGADTK